MQKTKDIYNSNKNTLKNKLILLILQTLRLTKDTIIKNIRLIA